MLAIDMHYLYCCKPPLWDENSYCQASCL